MPFGTAYNRTKFIKDRRRMMDLWADGYLGRLKAGADVVAIGRLGKPTKQHKSQLRTETLRYTLARSRASNTRGCKPSLKPEAKRGSSPPRTETGRQLARLHTAKASEDMNLPGWRLHPLQGELADHFSVTVNGNWRLTFRFDRIDGFWSTAGPGPTDKDST